MSTEVMQLLNSEMPMSNDDIVMMIEYVDWHMLNRQLPECIVYRFSRKIVDWNKQLYGEPRTLEFIITYRNRFNWDELSKSPPIWFTEYHAELFEDELNWYLLTRHAIHYSLDLLCRNTDRLDWNWITRNGIPDEAFAKRFINRIDWDCDDLDVSNLSTEFLYELECARMMEYNLHHGIDTIPRLTRFNLILSPITIQSYKPSSKIRIGGSITVSFFRRHYEDIDMEDIKKRNLLTEDIMMIVHNMENL
jgi:hypothetical protein